jgi:hypothetical protein
MSTDKTEPPGSASSSPDDKCRCGHTRKAHEKNCCNACPGDEERSWRHAFVPAKPEASRLCRCGHPMSEHRPGGGCPWEACSCETAIDGELSRHLVATNPRNTGWYWECRNCGAFSGKFSSDESAIQYGLKEHLMCPAEPDAAQKAAMDELIHLRQEMEETEPEAPECRDAEGCHRVVPCNPGCAVVSRQLYEQLAKATEPPQRLPFTLTYALASGERREVTLSGDVAVRVAEDGALTITHESLIRALTEIRPNKDTE